MADRKEKQRNSQKKTRQGLKDSGKTQIAVWVNNDSLTIIDNDKEKLGLKTRGEVIDYYTKKYNNNSD